MASTSLPWLYLNLGCEMLYVLEERLIAQAVPYERACTGAFVYMCRPQGARNFFFLLFFLYSFPPPTLPSLQFIKENPFSLHISCIIFSILDPVPRRFAVLEQVIQAMFNSDLLEDIFQRQPLYSLRSLRAIFEKVSQCSVMRLNTTSMDKASG